MRESLSNYLNKIDKIINEKNIKDKEIINDHLTQIQIFQHERLIHLIVTVFVGLISILFLLFGIMLENITLLLLFYIALALFIPYILHYYFLENGVQKLYKQYELLKKEVIKK